VNHNDHVDLIRAGVHGTTWADLGSGTGAFTLALADVLGEAAQIFSVDRERGALDEQRHAITARFPSTQVQYIVGDFTRPLDLPLLDGILMANSLHFHRDKVSILARLKSHLKPDGRLILVEYNADSGNPWVPFPLSFPTWQKLAAQVGFRETRLLNTRPSRFLREIYSAVSLL
jgi:ubiquinone/menaquinone biosynthesis C-methylase UbiE